MTTIETCWPPFGLHLRAGDLELAPMREADLPELVDLVLAGIHDPARMPFLFPWTDRPADEAPAAYVRYYAEVVATQQPGTVRLELVVRERGRVVGVQSLAGAGYPVLRTLETGSWLGRAHQGRGIGTRMRQAACAFAFDDLGAARITSNAFVDNPASLGVSRAVGYRPNGRRWAAPRGVAAEEQMLLLLPEDLVRGEPVVATGVDAYRAFVGLEPRERSSER